MHSAQAVAGAVERAVLQYDGSPFTLRPAGIEDVPAVLGLFDAAVVWLNGRGNTEQWGTTPFSTDPKRRASVAAWITTGGAVLAHRGDAVAGAMFVGEATAYAPPAPEPELYVVGLVGGRAPLVRGAGRVLLGFAPSVARELGVGLLRVDCYAGGDRQLVQFYESAGFTPTEPFEVRGWPGQVLERRLNR